MFRYNINEVTSNDAWLINEQTNCTTHLDVIITKLSKVLVLITIGANNNEADNNGVE